MSTRAVILLSGGIDSATCLALARKKNRAVYALSLDYGQRHRAELKFARALARRLACVAHRVIRIEVPGKAASSLTSKRLAVPKRGVRKRIIPSTYVPARNTIFLSLALSWAESVGASEIWIGANVLDYSGYPDCRPEYLRAFEKAANLGTRAGVSRQRSFRIVAPLLKMSKAEIVRKGASLGVDFSRTLSCYDPDPSGKPCGGCDSCRIRGRAFDLPGQSRGVNTRMRKA
jgi:7-cyano-7-deazaguanine synthase